MAKEIHVRLERKIKAGYKRPTFKYDGLLGSGEGNGAPQHNPNEALFPIVLIGVIVIGCILGLCVLGMIAGAMKAP